MGTFYLVWNPEAGKPSQKHYDALEAALEANRLSQKHVGQSFYVMKAMERYTAEIPVKIDTL